MKTLKLRLTAWMIMLLLITLSPVSVFSQQDPPQRINFQGVLRDADSQPLSATIDAIFSFYDSAIGGHLLWQESYNLAYPPQLTVSSGLFAVQFGDPSHKTGGGASDLRSVFLTRSDVYLAIAINHDVEMDPRIKVVSAGFSMNSSALDGRVATDFALPGHTHTLATGAADVTATAAELNKLSGIGPMVTAANLTTLTDGSNADALHNHNFIGPCDAAFLRKDVDASTTGRLKFSGISTGTSVTSGSVVINPPSASADETLLGVAVGGSRLLSVDAEGDVTIPGTLAVGNSAETTAGTTLTIAADFSASSATGMDVSLDYQASSGDSSAISGEARAEASGNDVEVFGVKGQADGDSGSDGNRYGIRGTAGPDPSNGPHYGIFSEVNSDETDSWGFDTPNSMKIASDLTCQDGIHIGGGDSSCLLLVADSDGGTAFDGEKRPHRFYQDCEDTPGDDRSTIYVLRTRTTASNGSSYALGGCNKAVEGSSLNGDSYTFGVHGNTQLDGCFLPPCDYRIRRSGGILGALSSGTYWGSLGYNTSTNSKYGGYFTSNGLGSGKSSLVEGIGLGSYGDLMGGWIKGEECGLYVSGNRYATYSRGDRYVSGYQAFRQVHQEQTSFSYAVSTPAHEIVAHGAGILSPGKEKARVSFPATFQRLVSKSHPVHVVCTPLEGTRGIAVSSVSGTGFEVRGEENYEESHFSWMAIGSRIGYEQIEIPEELRRLDFEENMDRVAFNENILDDQGLGIFYDGTLSFSTPSALSDKMIDDLHTDGSFTSAGDIFTTIEKKELAHKSVVHSEAVKQIEDDHLEMGDVIVLDHSTGNRVRRCTASEDPAVLGIVSEHVSVVAGRNTILAAPGTRVLCKVDASYGPIHRGDLLTTSATPGHAMRNDDPQVGTVIGKALEDFDRGAGLISVLALIR